MANTSDLSKGAFIRMNGALCQVLDIVHRTPGKGQAIYQVKMRNVQTGKLAENRFRSGENIELVRVEQKDLQYLYRDDTNLVCMDNDTYEQIYVNADLFGDSLKFVKEGMNVSISFDDELAVSGAAPKHVELEITYTEPGIKGDTATNTLKPAEVETGVEVRVPLFCDTGDMIKVDTETGEYVERVKK